jgi:hypothetical protein
MNWKFWQRKNDDDSLKVAFWQIGKMNLEPSDVLVFKTNRILSKEQADRLREIAKVAIPGIKALVLEDGLDLSVLSGAQKAAVASAFRCGEAQARI